MTHSEFDAYRPPEPERRGRRRKGGSGRRRATGPARRPDLGGGDGSREMSMVGEPQFENYYGRPIVKAPPWKAPIAVYLFVGGLAGASSLIGVAAGATGRPVMRRTARLTALGSVLVGTVALIEDLGRPERFYKMLRVVKPTSPMSIGTWLLSGFASAAGVAAAGEVDRMLDERLPLGPLRPVLHAVEGPAALGSAVLGAPLATYTAVLLGDTAVPTWSAARHGLAFVFGSSATMAASGMQLLAAPVEETGPARALAVAGVIGDVAGMQYTTSQMHELEAEPLEEGTPGTLMKAAEVLAIAGGIGALVGGRVRPVAAVSGVALLAASALTRFGVLYAGLESVKDPRRVVEPQKARLAARRARGIVHDSITTTAPPRAAERVDSEQTGPGPERPEATHPGAVEPGEKDRREG